MKIAGNNSAMVMVLLAAFAAGPVGNVVQAQSSSASDSGAKADMKKAGTETKDAAKDTGSGVKQGTKKAYHATKNGTTKAYDKTKSTTKGAVNGAKSGAKQPANTDQK